MTIEELMRSARSENERKKVLLAYYKGFNEGVRISLQLLVEEDNNNANGVEDT